MSPKLRPLIPLGLFLGSLSVGYIALAWTAPTTTPPGNNVSAPINVSNTAQNKAGNLYIGSSSGSSAFPLRVVGNGIDTSTLYVDAGSVFAGNPSVNQWDSQYYSTDTAGSNTARHDIGGAHGWDQNMLYINGWNDWTSGVSVGGPGGASNLTVTGSLCLNGSCKSDWSQVSGSSYWTLSGSNLYPNSTSYNVGIGTSNPYRKLEVNNAMRFTNSSSDTNDGVIGTAPFAAGLNIVGINTDGSGRKITEWGSIIQNENSVGNSFWGNTFFNGGNVGIGTGGPQQNLSVQNGLQIDEANANAGALNNGATSGNGLIFGWGSGEGISSKRNAGGNQYGLDFWTGFADRMSITQGGNVGIGTTGPAGKLDVNGTICISGNCISSWSQASGGGSAVTELAFGSSAFTLTKTETVEVDYGSDVGQSTSGAPNCQASSWVDTMYLQESVGGGSPFNADYVYFYSYCGGGLTSQSGVYRVSLPAGTYNFSLNIVGTQYQTLSVYKQWIRVLQIGS